MDQPNLGVLSNGVERSSQDEFDLPLDLIGEIDHGLKVFLQQLLVRRRLVRQLVQLEQEIVTGVLKLDKTLEKNEAEFYVT